MCPESIKNALIKMFYRDDKKKKKLKTTEAYDRKYKNSVDFVHILRKLQNANMYCKSNSTTMQ